MKPVLTGMPQESNHLTCHCWVLFNQTDKNPNTSSVIPLNWKNVQVKHRRICTFVIKLSLSVLDLLRLLAETMTPN